LFNKGFLIKLVQLYF